jgi:hypothetical protein
VLADRFHCVAEQLDKEFLGRQLAELRREITSTSERLRRLKDEEYGFALALARLTGGPHPRPPDVSDIGRGSSTSARLRLTPLVRLVLQRSAAPLTRSEVREILSAGGGAVSLDAVSASLSYLKRQGVAANVGGAWVAITEKEGPS